MFGNNIIQQFDIDTLETSSLVDNQEIKTGRIFIPDRNIMTSTIEGCNLADAKNEYLEQRMMIGENADKSEVDELVNNYYQKINYEDVLKYFNN
jgi:hypothetical protein